MNNVKLFLLGSSCFLFLNLFAPHKRDDVQMHVFPKSKIKYQSFKSKKNKIEWVWVDAHFVGDITRLKNCELGSPILEEKAENNFYLLSEAQSKKCFKALKTAIHGLLNREQALSSLINFKNTGPIIFTSGDEVATLGEGSSRINELLELVPEVFSQKPSSVTHVTVNAEGLNNAYIYTIAGKRRLLPFTNSTSPEPIDCYLLNLINQPAYMVLAHELLHVFLNKRPMEIIVPKISSFLSRHVLPQGKGDAYLEPLGQRLWTTSEEIAVIIGTEQTGDYVTENQLRKALSLPLRVLHKGYNLTSPDSIQCQKLCIYEPCYYLDDAFKRTLGMKPGDIASYQERTLNVSDKLPPFYIDLTTEASALDGWFRCNNVSPEASLASYQHTPSIESQNRRSGAFVGGGEKQALNIDNWNNNLDIDVSDPVARSAANSDDERNLAVTLEGDFKDLSRRSSEQSYEQSVSSHVNRAEDVN